MRIKFNFQHFIALFSFIGVMFFSACSSQTTNERQHFFLKGYDNLEFRDTAGNPVQPSEYIIPSRINGLRSYSVRDTSLTLVHKRTGNPYSGYIRTYHNDRYNLQGEFENGKMTRLRFWHPNRVLGMDAKFRNKTMSIWNEAGVLGASYNETERYYYYSGGQQIKEIIQDTMHSYFDKEGNLQRYTITTDTASIHYNAEGEMRAYYPFVKGKGLHGEVKQWHPNGQLKVSGKYKDGKQTGIWIQYDSLGNEINREDYGNK
jgi:antitoxin component YwqK of YwqJK toxin-antitoxin module